MKKTEGSGKVRERKNAAAKRGDRRRWPASVCSCMCVRVCACKCAQNAGEDVARENRKQAQATFLSAYFVHAVCLLAIYCCMHTVCFMLLSACYLSACCVRAVCLHATYMLLCSHAGEHVSAVGTHCRSPQLWTTCCVHVAPGAPPTPQVVPSSTVADARCDACTGAQERLDTNVLVDGQSTSSQAHKTLPCAGVDSRGRPHS
eukprot:1161298-Pelagomonas_calceolata.AAC.15